MSRYFIKSVSESTVWTWFNKWKRRTNNRVQYQSSTTKYGDRGS